MRIYSNSSYKYSPTGFAIGFVESSELTKDGYSLLKPCKDELIKKLFESGDVKFAYGKLPNSGKYVYLVKKLECSFRNDDNVEAKKYCNFAFVFDSVKEYSAFKINYNSQLLIRQMNSFIVPDGMIEKFGLKIQNSYLNEYINSCIKGDIPMDVDSELYIDTTSSNNDISKKLSELFLISLCKENGSLYSTKKKQIVPIPIIASVIAAAIITIIVVTLLAGNK